MSERTSEICWRRPPEEVFAKWLERQAASQAKENPDPVAMKIEALAGE